MKVSIRGKNKSVNLSNNDFIASGGQGKVYGKGSLIYKIYTNIKDMIPEAKIFELYNIKNPNILKPLDIVLDSKKRMIGFTMNRIKNHVPLCKVFTNTFRKENAVTDNSVIELVKNMQEGIISVHDANCIIVDGNEFNYLVDDVEFKNPYFIDVDSYQTASFPATVIMPSIRDWHSKTFNEMTDWYSFAIIACQLFIGIHPYKGKHPDFKKHDMEKRMKSNISIFNSNVTIPKKVRDISHIPSNYMDWFIDLFENGKRIAPPSTTGEVKAKVKFIIVKSTDNFDISEEFDYNEEILSYRTHAMIPIVRTTDHIYLGSTKYRVSPDVDIIHTDDLDSVFVKIDNEKLMLKETSGPYQDIECNIQCQEKMIVGNTVYVKNSGNLLELKLMKFGKEIKVLTKTVWTIMEKASKLFDNVIYQNVMGSTMLSVPHPKVNGNSYFISYKVPEIDGYRVLDAKYELGVCMVTVHDGSKYRMAIIKFGDIEKPHISYDFRFEDLDDYQDVNFVTLDNGIVISIINEKMEIFQNLIAKTTVKSISDPELDSEMFLCKKGVEVKFFTNNKIYKIKTK